MTEVITNNLDLWSSAILKKSTVGRGSNGKQEAYGIKKLRELILELAVRGKLLPQDPSDEPVSVLLGNIAKEKAVLIKEKKIQKPKVLPEFNAEEIPHELPEGWEWVRLQDVTVYIQRGKSPNYAENGRVRVISQKCVQWAGFDINQARYVDNDSLESYQAERYLQNNDLLWNSTGTGTVGRVNVLTNVEREKIVADSHVTVIRPLQLNSNFLWCYIAAPGIQVRIEPTHENSLVSGTTKQVELNTSAVVPLVVPIPPLAEQHRIVAKVDELMALCDQLEQQQTDSIDAHQTLVETLLGTLVNVESPEELTEAWTRIANHFDTLFTTERSIDQLKQTILQLAVMGKLVPQDPNDEPASVLLEKIGREKEKQIKKGKIRKQEPLPPIGEEENPFELPIGWEWIRFGELGEILGGGTPSKGKSEYWNGTIPWISPKDMKLDSIEDADDKITNEAVEGSTVKLIPVGSLLLVVRGMILFHSFPVAITQVPVTINQDMKAVTLSEYDRNFILLMMKGLKTEIVDLVDRSTHGTCKLVSNKLWNKVLAIPPLEEQHRIVAKVAEIMTLCDTLKARINEAQTTQIHLADAIVEQAVG